MKLQRLVKACILTLIYIAVGLWLNDGHDVYMGTVMIWNVFLGCLPILFSTLFVQAYSTKKRLLQIISFGAWLLFFPNSIYLITDFIHTNSSDFYQVSTGSVLYYKDLLAWAEFLYIGVGVIGGTTVGLYSFHQILEVFKKRFANWQGMIFKFMVFVLCGFGIYIGRFLRLNSWDILQPWSLIQLVVGQFDFFAVLYALMIGLYTSFIYEVFSIVVGKRGHDD